MQHRALILVDIQYDFLPGGALAVAEGDQVIPVANQLIPQFETIVATQDWHPKDHLSFASQHPGHEVGDVVEVEGLDQILWPDHCVQGSHGAAFAKELNTDAVAKVFQKGTIRQYDSYSGFFDNGHRHATGMGKWLKDSGVQQVVIAGLATDYCVKFTALDARELDFETLLITDGCRGVELHHGDIERALKDMQEAGVVLTTSQDL